MAQFDYDILVIGSGAAGLTAAKTAVGLGKKVALIEKNDVLGGECTWGGCVPSKTLIKSALVGYHIKNATKFGLTTDCDFGTENLMPYVRSVIKEVYKSHTPEKIAAYGIEVISGMPAKFVNAHTLQLDGHSTSRTITAKKIIIATGSRPFIPKIPGLDTVQFLTNRNLFLLDELPKSIFILGGGAIGTEMASAMARLGVAVTILEMEKRIMPKDDPELVEMLVQAMRADGVVVRTGFRVTKVAQEAGMVAVTGIDNNEQEYTLRAEKLLVAVGRAPNVESLDLAAAGIEVGPKGILADSQLRTTAKNVYVCGDVVGPYKFSHMAWYQAVIAARNACIPFFKKHADYSQVIWVTFAAPELAAAGLTEPEARAKYGDEIKVYSRSYGDLDRGITDRMVDGTLKVICDSKGYIIGAHMLGERAGDVIHELQVAKVKGIKLAALHDVIHAYPTYAELIWHVSRKAYLEQLENTWYVKLAKKLLFRNK
jgi:pyruvate/2-oxoglutarate dehydrogenase complex dihydrolipoamide dehydrogenase (E3) component